MKVSNNGNNNAVNSAQANASGSIANSKKTKGDNPLLQASTDKAAIASSSKVNVSERAQDVKKASDIARNAPDIDEAKVAKYQSLIDSGKYTIDSKKVADKMVDEFMTEFTNE